MTPFLPVVPNSFFLSPVLSSLDLAWRVQAKAGAAHWQGFVAASLQSKAALLQLTVLREERKMDLGWWSPSKRKLRVVQLIATFKPSQIIQESGFLWKPTGGVLL